MTMLHLHSALSTEGNVKKRLVTSENRTQTVITEIRQSKNSHYSGQSMSKVIISGLLWVKCVSLPKPPRFYQAVVALQGVALVHKYTETFDYRLSLSNKI